MKLPRIKAVVTGLVLLSGACAAESEPAAVATTAQVETTEAPTTTTAPTTTQAPTTTAAPTTTEASTTSVPPKLYEVGIYDPERDPQTDLEAAQLRASTEGKQVILEVGGDWCPDCVNLVAFLEANPEVNAQLAERFVMVKVNLSAENENKEFLSGYPAFEWVPHFYIVNADGSLAESYDTRGLQENTKFTVAAFDAFLAGR